MKKVSKILVSIMFVLFVSTALTACLRRNEEEIETKNITTVQQFLDIKYQKPSSGKIKYVLKNDLDFSGVTYINPLMTAKYGSDVEDNSFNNIIDGEGHSIKNLTVYGKYASLLGAVGATGEVLNLKFENINITGETHIGAVAGYCSENYPRFTNIEIVSGTIGSNSSSIVGGLVGYSPGESIVKNCINRAEIKGTSSLGGLFGYAFYPVFTDCVNYGKIEVVGNSSVDTIGNVGGVIGVVQYDNWASDDTAVLKGVKNYGEVYAPNQTDVGGIVGHINYRKSDIRVASLNLIVRDIENHGKVTGYSQVGGVIGDALDVIDKNRKIEELVLRRLKNTGNVTAINQCAGGIIGQIYTDAQVNNCENSGTITANLKVGGIVGVNGAITSCTNNGKVVLGNEDTTSAYLSYAGGIVGYIESEEGKVNKCVNNGKVTILEEESATKAKSYYYIGGIAGYAKNSQIQKSENTGDIVGQTDVGGIVGYIENSTAKIIDFYKNKNSGTVTSYGSTGSNYRQGVGGLVGGIRFNDKTENIYIVDCSNTGNINIYNNVKGVAGLVGTISYTTDEEVDVKTTEILTIEDCEVKTIITTYDSTGFEDYTFTVIGCLHLLEATNTSTSLIKFTNSRVRTSDNINAEADVYLISASTND